MAIKSVVVIYDAKSEIYTPPNFFNTKLDAMRSIKHLMASQPEHAYSVFSEDFTMYEIATYNEETLSFVTHPQPLELESLSVIKASAG